MTMYHVLSTPVSVGLSPVRGLTVLLRESGAGYWEADVVEPPDAAVTSGVYLTPEGACAALDRRLRALDVGLATGRPRGRRGPMLRAAPVSGRRPWTEAEDVAVRSLDDPRTIAHALGRTYAAVLTRRSVLRAREEVTA